MNSDNATIYSLYANDGFSWSLAISAISLNAIAIPGMILNFSVIWVTLRSKSLHGTDNYLLALCSFYELLHQHGHLLFLFMAISGKNFLPYGLAVKICTVSIFGLGGIAPSMAFTGLDRLFCVLLPNFPKMANNALYLGAITTISMVFCTVTVVNLYNNNVNPETMVTGTIADITPVGWAGQLYNNMSFAIYSITIGIYLLVGIVFKFRSVPNTANEHKNRRIFRALFTIITLNVGGYYLMRIYRFALVPFINSSVTNWFLAQAFSLPLNVSAASNAPILFFTSKEYRIQFEREFGFLAKANTLHPTAVALVPVQVKMHPIMRDDQQSRGIDGGKRMNISRG